MKIDAHSDLRSAVKNLCWAAEAYLQGTVDKNVLRERVRIWRKAEAEVSKLAFSKSAP